MTYRDTGRAACESEGIKLFHSCLAPSRRLIEPDEFHEIVVLHEIRRTGTDLIDALRPVNLRRYQTLIAEAVCDFRIQLLMHRHHA
jgi:hypothetical protein